MSENQPGSASVGAPRRPHGKRLRYRLESGAVRFAVWFFPKLPHPLVRLLGNAAGVSIRYNGSEIAQPGPRGQVRTVEFTPQGSRVVEPNKVVPDEGEQQ